MNNTILIISGLILFLIITLIIMIYIYREKFLKEEKRKHLEKDMEIYSTRKKYNSFNDFLEDTKNQMSITDYIDHELSKLNKRELETMWARATKKK